MNRFDRMGEQWQQFCEKMRPIMEKIGRFFRHLGQDLATIVRYMYKLRAIILCAPVAAAAVVVASINMDKLPDAVSILLPAIDTGAEDALFGFLVFAQTYIDKGAAVIGCMMVTGLCLLMTLLSKRTMYPWLISVFSFSLPALLRVTNDPAVVQDIMDTLSGILMKFLG